MQTRNMPIIKHLRGVSESWLNLVEVLLSLARCRSGGILLSGEHGVGKKSLWEMYIEVSDYKHPYVLISGHSRQAFQEWQTAFENRTPFFIEHWNTWPDESVKLILQRMSTSPEWEHIPWGGSLLENNPDQARNWIHRNRYRHTHLYYLHIPPLRERIEDISVIAQYLLITVAEQYGKSVHGWTPEAMDLLRRHPWWGNVRELSEVVKHAVARHKNGLLIDEHTTRKALRRVQNYGSSHDAGDRVRIFIHRMFQYLTEHPELCRNLKPWHYVLDEIRHHATISILQLTHQNVDEASRILGIHSRTLRRYSRNRHTLNPIS